MNNYPKEQNGLIFACDKNGRHLVIEWHITNITSPTLAHFKREVSDLASQVTARSETEFLKQFPDAVSSGGFLKSCEPLLTHDSEHIDWKEVEQTLQQSLKQFYTADLSLFGAETISKLKHDIYFFAAIRNQATSQLLGFLMSAITPALPKGDIKLINLIVSSQENDLEKLLLDSLAALPQAKRIFTMIRPTGAHMLQALQSYGFTEDKAPVQDPHHPLDKRYFVVLEYTIDKPSLIQEVDHRLFE
jgi:hypothetical protein